WRADRRIVRAYDVATLIWVLVFAARFVVQRWLYDNDETNALGIVRLAMGLPLTVVATAVTVWAARKARRLLAQPGAPPAARTPPAGRPTRPPAARPREPLPTQPASPDSPPRERPTLPQSPLM